MEGKNFFSRFFKGEDDIGPKIDAPPKSGKGASKETSKVKEKGNKKPKDIAKDSKSGKETSGKEEVEWMKVGVSEFDKLLDKGIPKGSAVLVCGGAGCGKTIFCLQTLVHGAKNGEKCLYMTFEEREERLKNHMRDFGWDPDKLEKDGTLLIKRFDPFEITRQVEAMLEKARGELLIDIAPVLIPGDYRPDRIALDSLSAIAAAFVGKEENYRIYIEQLFRFFENLGATSFLITETEHKPTKLTKSGVEEFLADGVIMLYNIRKGSVRQSAIEILKLRGAKFEKRIVPTEIVGGEGFVVYPTQEVYGYEQEGMGF